MGSIPMVGALALLVSVGYRVWILAKALSWVDPRAMGRDVRKISVNGNSSVAQTIDPPDGCPATRVYALPRLPLLFDSCRPSNGIEKTVLETIVMVESII